MRISVCLPAANEEATVGGIVATIARDLQRAVPLVDEIVVIDDNSTDATARVAARAGARVERESAILPELPAGTGKGNALWKSLYACHGDLICWIDADIRDFRSHFVSGLLAPLLDHDDVLFAKGFYRRPFLDAPSGGGRVTELMARPLLSLLFPGLADVVQPLAGEYAGRRRVLESVPFVEGWGVEFGLLVDIVARYGRDSIAQVDLGVRAHRNRSLDELGPQALAILVTALRRAGSAGARGEIAGLVRFDADYELEVVAVEVRERPPIVTVPSYRAKFAREATPPA